MTPAQSETLDFLIELAKSLHSYGSSADRLEAAVTNASLSLGVNASVFSTPTMLTLVFQFPDEAGRRTEITRLLRVVPGGVDLDKLTHTDKIGDGVLKRIITPMQGLEGLIRLQARAPLFPVSFKIIAYGLSSVGVCALFPVSGADLALAGLLGVVTGLVTELSSKQENLWSLHEAIAGFFGAALVKLVGRVVPELSAETVLLSGLVVLFPGLMMTVALRELATQNLASGVARLAGAGTVLLKLVVGVAMGSQIFTFASRRVLVLEPSGQIPDWASWAFLPVTVLSFAILYRAPLKKVPLIFVAVVAGLVASRFGNAWVGPNFGIFFAGCCVSALSNSFARLFKRPASITLVPGVIMLVPGSLSYRSLLEFWAADAVTGVQNGVNAVFFAASLAAGILFGNLIVPPRRSL